MMARSLLNRFRGAWTGAVIGEALAHRLGQLDPDLHPNRYQCLQLGYGSASQEAAMTIAQALLQPSLAHGQVISLPQQDAVIAAIALVPIVLLYGDDPNTLEQSLQRWESLTGIAFTQQAIVAHTLGLLLHDRCDPHHLLSYLSQQPTLSTAYPSLVNGFRILSNSLRRGSSLATTQDALAVLPSADQSYALALYCFLSTPDDSRLCLERAMRCGCQPIVTTAIAGMFTGACHGVLEMPMAWRDSSEAASLESIATRATRLFAHWCGVYDGRSLPPVDYETMAVGTPGTLRSLS